MLWGLTRRAVTLLHVLNTWFIAKLAKKKNEIKRFKHLRWYWYVWVLFYSVHIMQENSLLSGERNCTAGKIHTCWSRQVSPLLGVSFLIACFSFFLHFLGKISAWFLLTIGILLIWIWSLCYKWVLSDWTCNYQYSFGHYTTSAVLRYSATHDEDCVSADSWWRARHWQVTWGPGWLGLGPGSRSLPMAAQTVPTLPLLCNT